LLSLASACIPPSKEWYFVHHSYHIILCILKCSMPFFLYIILSTLIWCIFYHILMSSSKIPLIWQLPPIGFGNKVLWSSSGQQTQLRTPRGNDIILSMYQYTLPYPPCLIFLLPSKWLVASSISFKLYTTGLSDSNVASTPSNSVLHEQSHQKVTPLD